MKELQIHAAELERHCRDAVAEDEIEKSLGLTTASMHQAVEAASKLIASQTSGPSAALEPSAVSNEGKTVENPREILDRLLQLLEDSDASVEKLFLENQSSLRTILGELTEKVGRFIEDFEYEQAAELVSKKLDRE